MSCTSELSLVHFRKASSIVLERFAFFLSAAVMFQVSAVSEMLLYFYISPFLHKRWYVSPPASISVLSAYAHYAVTVPHFQSLQHSTL